MVAISSSGGIVRFGAFELDGKAGELRNAGTKIRLQEQPLQILQILLEHPGKVISREELRQKVWPSDTFVDFDHGIYNAIKRLREALGDTAETPRYVETLPRRGYRFIGSAEVPTKTTASRIQSLAVLPLENLSRDPEQDYFADGMTEALIAGLAKIAALRLISRTTVMCYKGKRQPLPEIARELGVDAVIEGTVLRWGDRVRISAQLIEASTDSHIWAESYEGSLRDVLALQAEVARAIASEIQVKLTPQEHAYFTKARAVDPEAYEAYLKGRYFWNKRTGTNIKKAAEFFQVAIDKDANYAAAYAGLADALVVLGYWGFTPPESSAGRARIVAAKALELDDTSAEAHASLAFALLQYDRDFLKAEREFSRAIELDPGYATARQWHALCLSVTGNSDEAIKEIERAVELDPVSSIIHVAFAGILGFARRWHDAMDESQRALDLDPSVFPASWVMGWTSLHAGECSRATKMFEEGVKSSGGAALFLFGLAISFAAAGEPDAARKVLLQLEKMSSHIYVMPYWIAAVYAVLSENDLAFRWFEHAYEEHSAWIVFLKVYPWPHSLRSDSRFDDLMRRMHFPESACRALVL